MTYTKAGPFVDGSAPYLSAAFFNNLETALGGAVTSISIAPAATGTAATDTANLAAAISAAQANFQDLYLPGGHYLLSNPIVWNANRGSLYGRGDVILDLSTATFTGPALTVTGNGTTGTVNGENLSHAGIRYRVEGFKLVGPDTDATAMDGLLFTDAGIGIDYPTVRHLQIVGFRDGVTYGDNTWSQSLERCTIAKCHRYGVNLQCGVVSGECMTFDHTSIFGCHNTAGNAVAVYCPPLSHAEFRMIGGSLDYNDIEGVLLGGAVAFDKVHIEDNSTGPMFQYGMTTGQDPLAVTFRDIYWDSSYTGVRDHLHEIVASSGDSITIVFDGDKGSLAGAGGTVNTWLVNNSGITDLVPTVTFLHWGVSSGNSAGISLGDFVNLLSNGSFDDTQTFVATPGVRGWYASGSATFGYSGTPTGQGMRCVTASALTGNVQQRIPVGGIRRPLRIGTTISSTSWTAGTAGVYYQFYGEDGTTTVGAQYRVGVDVSSNLAGVYKRYSVRVVPPKGAVYLMVMLNVNGWQGTAYWDNIEVVPV